MENESVVDSSHDFQVAPMLPESKLALSLMIGT